MGSSSREMTREQVQALKTGHNQAGPSNSAPPPTEKPPNAGLLMEATLDEHIQQSRDKPKKPTAHQIRTGKAELTAAAASHLRAANAQRCLERVRAEKLAIQREEAALAWSVRFNRDPFDYDEELDTPRRHQVLADRRFAEQLTDNPPDFELEDQQESDSRLAQQMQEEEDAAAAAPAEHKTYAQTLQSPPCNRSQSPNGTAKPAARLASVVVIPPAEPAAKPAAATAAQPAAKPLSKKAQKRANKAAALAANVTKPADHAADAPAAEVPQRKDTEREEEQLNYDGVWSDDEADPMDIDSAAPQPRDAVNTAPAPGPAENAAPQPAANADAQPTDTDSTQLTPAKRLAISKLLKYALFCTHDKWATLPDNKPVGWVDNLRSDLIASGIKPDHAVGLLKETHLGETTASTMATWMAANRGASWAAFREASCNVTLVSLHL